MMETEKNAVLEIDSLDFIYYGLGSMSAEGLKRLKGLALSLLAAQNCPGAPLPDSVRREILREPAIRGLSRSNVSKKGNK